MSEQVTQALEWEYWDCDREYYFPDDSGRNWWPVYAYPHLAASVRVLIANCPTFKAAEEIVRAHNLITEIRPIVGAMAEDIAKHEKRHEEVRAEIAKGGRKTDGRII